MIIRGTKLNGKKAKALRREADKIVLEWVQSLLDRAEAEQVDLMNLHEHLPDELYFYAQGQRRLNVMSPKWVYKRLKRGKDIGLS